MPYHLSKAEFGRLVEKALEELPEPFAQHMEEIAIEVRDSPTASQLGCAGTRSGQLLLGLYHGRPRTQRSVMDEMVLPDVIYVFQQNIERVVDSERELIRQVRTTVLHEIGHHYGMSEEDLEELGYG
jgi:predicted Zn-dependent protease with MMP-like domain